MKNEADGANIHKNNRRGKFLKKLWSCVAIRRRVQQGNLVLSIELIRLIGHRKEFKSWRFER